MSDSCEPFESEKMPHSCHTSLTCHCWVNSSYRFRVDWLLGCRDGLMPQAGVGKGSCKPKQFHLPSASWTQSWCTFSAPLGGPKSKGKSLSCLQRQRDPQPSRGVGSVSLSPWARAPAPLPALVLLAPCPMAAFTIRALGAISTLVGTAQFLGTLAAPAGADIWICLRRKKMVCEGLPAWWWGCSGFIHMGSPRNPDLVNQRCFVFSSSLLYLSKIRGPYHVDISMQDLSKFNASWSTTTRPGEPRYGFH